MKPSRAPPSWLALAAAACALVLLGLVALQVNQLWRLNRALAAAEELRTAQMHRQETEYLQLREQWQRALDVQQPVDRRGLMLRWDIWVGRIAMLVEDTSLRRTAVAVVPELDRTLARASAFIARADRLLAGADDTAAWRRSLAELQPGLIGLGDELHDLALTASHLDTAEQVQRTRVLERHTRVTLGLTALLALFGLALVALSLRQMRQLGKRRDALEALSADLRQAHHTAQSHSQAKTRFLANMSHEIRTPLQGLLGTLSLLRETGLDPRQRDYLRTAAESADHLHAVIDDILDMSQLEAGRLELHPAPVQLDSLLRDVASLMQSQAAARGARLSVSAVAGLPATVRLDATRVKQVLVNLLANAIKFSAQGEVVLDLRTAGSEPALHFVVQDSGIGMDSATLERVFGRFERGAATGAAGAPGGHGLGLDISRSLARLMGGDVLADSVAGRGSRFTLVLPLEAVAEATPAPGFAPQPLREAVMQESPPTAPALRVLVAEDHDVNRQVLSALIDHLGHRAHFVAGGEEALAAVQRERFDLVLMDLHMPGLDGIEATRRIRALPERAAATVPIVALTADAFTETRERCLVAGMNSFLGKPVSIDKLAALLRQLFGSEAGIGAAGAAADTGAAPPVPLSTRGEGFEPHAAPLLDSAAVASTVELLTAERYARLLGEHLDHAAASVAQLRGAVRDALPQVLRGHAHAARGAAASLGLSALSATAQALQEGATLLPAHEIARLVQRFEEQVHATREAARRGGLLSVDPAPAAAVPSAPPNAPAAALQAGFK